MPLLTTFQLALIARVLRVTRAIFHAAYSSPFSAHAATPLLFSYCFFARHYFDVIRRRFDYDISLFSHCPP
jgi:hypothetical protein